MSLEQLAKKFGQDAEKYERFAEIARQHFEENPGDIKPKPRPTHVVNGVTVPTPLTWEERHEYRSFSDVDRSKPIACIIDIDGRIDRLSWDESCKYAFISGHFFASESDAKENRGAIMKGA